MRIEQFLSLSALRNPDKTALVVGPVRLTYADLDHRTNGLAAALQQDGVGRGDRVLVFMDNCAEAVLAIFSTLKVGAAIVPVSAGTKAEKLRFLIGDIRPVAIFTQRKLAGIVAKAMGDDDITILVADTPEFYAALTETEPLAPLEAPDTDLAMVIYTSGSTGMPKGVMMTHRNVDATSAAIVSYLGATSDDVTLSVLPLAFNYGLYQLLTTVRTGATLVLEKSFAFPAAVIETLRQEHATTFPLVPTIAAILLQHAELLSAPLPQLRTITSAAAPLPPEHIKRLRQLLPGVALVSMYGQTECGRGTALPAEEIDGRPASAGLPIPGTSAAILDENELPLPPYSVGQLALTGPHIMQGYWENPAASAAVLRAGRTPGERTLLTGDLFYADANGYLFFVGRQDDIIKTRGEKVAPREVEAVLHAIPGVAEAVVVGVPDPVLGETIKAIVVRSNASLTAGEVMRAAARDLDDVMVPRIVEFRDSLPRTESGKVSRRLAATPLETA